MFDKFFDFIVSILDLFRFWYVMPVEHAGFVRWFGVPTRDLRPGWNWICPFRVETTSSCEMRQWSDVLSAQSLRTKDGVDLVVRLMVAYQVEDARKFLLNVYDATNNIQDLAAGALGAAIAKAKAADVYSGDVIDRVHTRVKTAARRWGIEVIKCQLTDVVAAPTYRLLGATKDES